MSTLTPDDRNWAVAGHLSAFAGVAVPFGNIVGPLVVWLMKKTQSEFAAVHAKEALNFQITWTLASLFCCSVSFAALFGGVLASSHANSSPAALFSGQAVVMLLLLAFKVVEWVFVIRGAFVANRGERYEYPFNLRLIS